jgi:hypothetical protein
MQHTESDWASFRIHVRNTKFNNPYLHLWFLGQRMLNFSPIYKLNPFVQYFFYSSNSIISLKGRYIYTYVWSINIGHWQHVQITSFNWHTYIWGIAHCLDALQYINAICQEMEPELAFRQHAFCNPCTIQGVNEWLLKHKVSWSHDCPCDNVQNKYVKTKQWIQNWSREI